MKNCKRLSALLLAVLIMTVCLCLPVSAAETKPGFGSVDLPFSFFSLNDGNPNRNLTMSGYVRWGFDALDSVVVDSFNVDFTHSVVDGRNNVVIDTYTRDYAGTTALLRVAAGTTIDLIAPVDYSSENYQNVTFTGVGQFYLFLESSSVINLYPEEVVLLVNGEEYGEIYDASSGFSMYSINLPLSEDITSLGYRFIWNNLAEVSGSIGSQSFRTLKAAYIDTGSFVVAEQEREPEYSGILETIVGWLRNLWDGITGIPDALYELFFPDQDVQQGQADDFNSTVADKQEQAEGVLDTMDTLETPDPEDIIPDIEVIISGEDYARYTDVFAQLLSNQMILNFFLVVASMAFVSYVLFGKKG